MAIVDETELAEVPTHPLALTAFGLAFLGLALPVIPSVAALVTATVARRKIISSNGTYKGTGLARGAQLIAALGLLGMALFAATITFIL
jgi:hypothetical protein